MRRLLCVVVAAGLWGASDAAAATLTLRAGREDVLVGERTRLAGALAGVTDRARRTVVLEADPYPYDGWVVAERVRTDRRGRFTALAEPRRNMRVRARLADDPAVASAARTIHADRPARLSRSGGGGATPRVRVTMVAPRTAAVRRGPVHAYLSRAPGDPWRLVDTRRWTTQTRRLAAATLRYPAGSLTRAHRAFVCIREPDPDAFGRPDPREKRCGDPEIPRIPAGAPAPPVAGPPPVTAPPAAAPAPPPPGSDPRSQPGAWSFTIAGDPGERFTGGQAFAYGPPAQVNILIPGGTEIEFRVFPHDGRPSWGGIFRTPDGSRLEPGRRYAPAGDPSGTGAFMSVSGNDKSCRHLSGEFTVHDFVIGADGWLDHARVSFVQSCEGGPVARGTLDYRPAG